MTANNDSAKPLEHAVSAWIPWALAHLTRTILRCNRVRRRGDPAAIEAALEKPCIFVSWHNRLLFLPPIFPRPLCKHVTALASQSKDGAYAAAYIAQFGGQVVRGSSSRGGLRALYSLAQELSNGRSVVLTPDGPRGPCYSIQPGTLILAEKSGAPIVPLSLNAPRRWQLKSWDNTQIPKPFGTVEFAIGTPLVIPPKPSAEERAAYAETLRQRLMDITDDTRR